MRPQCSDCLNELPCRCDPFIAHNVCNKCGFLWHSPVGPGASCPNPKHCDSVYWTWVNYNKEIIPLRCSVCKIGFKR
jgi:hypothetical protein